MTKTRILQLIAVLAVVGLEACGSGPDASAQPQSSSGVSIAHTTVAVGSDGLTTEQRNIKDRLAMDNKPGSIKHLYVISAYSGQVIIYSTVRGKVTSGGKRLTPNTVAAGVSNSSNDVQRFGIKVDIAGETYRTGEVTQDDGTYGTSDPYIYWFDTRGVYHQHFLAGGQIVHVSDQPLAVKNIIINMELEPNK